MNRIWLIQEIFRKTNFKNYLEIGCRTGSSFLPINARHKTAVDPVFRVPILFKIKYVIKIPNNLNNKYFEEESDIFFLRREKYLEKIGGFDVVLVDGLHTFQNSLNDVINSLKYLNDNGIIIMHDCFPPHRLASLPLEHYGSLDEMKKIEGWTSEWNGDVWKTIVYLRRNFNELLNICVIDTDYGLGIIRPKGSDKKIDIKNLLIDEKSYNEIKNLTYEELMQNTVVMLNLKKREYAYTLIDEITKHNINK